MGSLNDSKWAVRSASPVFVPSSRDSSLREHLNNAGMSDFNIGGGPASGTLRPNTSTKPVSATATPHSNRSIQSRGGLRPEVHPFILNLATDSSSFMRAATASLSSLEPSQPQATNAQGNQLPVERLAQTLRSSSLSTSQSRISIQNQAGSSSQLHAGIENPVDAMASPSQGGKEGTSSHELNQLTLEGDLAKLAVVEKQIRDKRETYATQIEDAGKKLADSLTRKTELQTQMVTYGKSLSEATEELDRIEKLRMENENNLRLTRLEAKALEEKYSQFKTETLKLTGARAKATAHKAEVEGRILPIREKLARLDSEMSHLEDEKGKAATVKEQLDSHLKKLEGEKIQLAERIAQVKAEATKKAAEAQVALEAKRAAEAQAALEIKKAADAQAALKARKAADAKTLEAKQVAAAQAALDAKKSAEAKIAETKAAVALKAAEVRKAAEAARVLEQAQSKATPDSRHQRNPGLSASIHAPPEFRTAVDTAFDPEPRLNAVGYSSTFSAGLQGSKYTARTTPFDAPRSADRSGVTTENQDTFSAWPQASERSADTSVVRRVHLRNLPRWANISVITGLVWGGDLQDIVYQDGDPTAEVLFLRGEDCQAYYTATSNGIECPGEPSRTIYVDLHPTPDPVHQLVRDLIARGHTRCVRAIPPGDNIEFTPQKLIALANGEVATGKVAYRIESVLMGPTSKKKVAVLFRYGSIREATYSYAWLRKELDHYQFIFDADPCRSRNKIDEVTIVGRRDKALKKDAATAGSPMANNGSD